MEASETFGGGKQYCLIIEYDLVEDATVSESAEVRHDLPGGIATYSSSARKVAITYTVPATYAVTVTTDGNGTASASHTTAAEGTTVTLTATPNEGYELDKWEIVRPISFTLPANSFTMPA